MPLQLIQEAKRSFREKISRERKLAFLSLRNRAKQNACVFLDALPSYVQSKCIGLYASDENEFPTHAIFEKARQEGKRVLFPKVVGKGLEFREVSMWRDLYPGYRGLLEPRFSPSSRDQDMDLVLVPGVAFDRSGNRLGRGGGYYDRFLSQKSPSTFSSVGLAFEFQIVDAVPIDKRDTKVDFLLTEKSLYRC